MDKYSRNIRLRMAWWVTWWLILVLFSIGELLNLVSAYQYPQYATSFSVGVDLFWLLSFIALAIRFIPSINILLERDLKRNPDNIYAKAMALERKVKQQARKSTQDKKEDDLRAHIKEMEEQVGESEKKKE